jgi:hypothetical protein
MGKGDLYKEIVKIINKWKPLKRYKGELASYSDIRDFIDDNINSKKRTKISVKAKNTLAKTDISVGNDKVAIEVKYNLVGYGNVRRLVNEVRTQSRAYKEGLIILLLGKINKSDLSDTRDEIKVIRRELNRGKKYKFKIDIIEKPLTELRKEKKIVKKKSVKRRSVKRKKRDSDDFFGNLWG